MNWMYWCQGAIFVMLFVRFMRGLLYFFGEATDRISQVENRKNLTSGEKGLAIFIGLSVFLVLWFVVLWVFYTAGTFSELF